jgi:hypothetical protein
MSVSAFILAGLLALQGALPEQLVVSLTVTDKKGKPVEDLKAGEVQVVENGTARPVDKLELDRRPLTVALVIDTSAGVGSFLRPDFVPAAVGFLQRLPSGSTFSVWATSDRPKLLVPEGTDIKAAEDALRSVAPFGNNAAVDTIIAASQELAKAEGRRTAVVSVVSASMGDVSIDVGSELPKASMRPVYMVVEVIVGAQDARLEDAVKSLTSRTGGFHERVFSTMAVEGQLRRVNDLLMAQYRAGYKPTADPRSTKIEVKVARKDTRTRMAQRLSVGW